MYRLAVMVAVVLLCLLSRAGGAAVVVEDWTGQRLGVTGTPNGWRAYATLGGRPAYDFVVTDEGGRRALQLRSRDDHSTIAKPLAVDLAATPILEWSWKIVEVPEGADVRQKATSDLTAHVLVVWPRFPEAIRSRLIAYAWGSREPAGSVARSRKTSTVTFIVLRSGAEGLGRWHTERRDVAADFRQLYGTAPDNPAALALSIDTNDTHSRAAGFIGAIAFTSR